MERSKGIQCHECDGFGHVEAECANTLRRKKQVMTTTWSDVESEISQEENEKHVSNHSALNVYTNLSGNKVLEDFCPESVVQNVATSSRTTSRQLDFETESDSDEDENSVLNEGEFIEAYEEMFKMWKIASKKNIELTEMVKSLESEKEKLKNLALEHELFAAESQKKLNNSLNELHHLQERVDFFNSGTTKLDHILSLQRHNSDRTGLGFEEKVSTPMTLFVKESTREQSSTQKFAGKNTTFVPICHFCGMSGHIRPRCYKYINALTKGMLFKSVNSGRSRSIHRTRDYLRQPIIRKIWVKKSDLNDFMACSSLKAYSGKNSF